MPGSFDHILISQIQQANDIVDLVSEHLTLTRKGKEMVGLCPFHSDNRPSLYVNEPKQIFKCFACGAGGDVFKFIQLRENITFPQAVERLANRAGINLPEQRTSRTRTDSNQVDPKKLAEINAWAVKQWQNNLRDKQAGLQARNYLKERKISPESIKKWQLGITTSQWDGLLNLAKTDALDISLLQNAGLLVARQGQQGWYDKFRSRLMFPITDVSDRVIGFGGRTMVGDDAKYMNSPATILFDKSNSLYGLSQARKKIVSTGIAVIVEGYTDCIMAHQFGCENVVAALGTSLTAGHARILRRYANKIVLVFDNDVAGAEAANRALDVCLAEKIDISIATIAQGKDPCDFLLSEGKQSFENLIDNAVDVMEFKWNRLKDTFTGTMSTRQKKQAMDEFLASAATAISAGRLDVVDKGLIANKLSKILGLSSSEINSELARRTKRQTQTISYANKNRKVVSLNIGQGFFAKAQQEILEVILNEPKLYSQARKTISVESFDVPALKQIASVVFECLDENQSTPLATILARVEQVDLAALIVELAQAGKEKDNFENRLKGAASAIKEHQDTVHKNRITALDDETESLKRFNEKLLKSNLRNPGMI